MRTPASIFGHPIHPMLIVFPIGLWNFSLACDLIRLAGASGDAWSTVAFYSMVGGMVGIGNIVDDPAKGVDGEHRPAFGLGHQPHRGVEGTARGLGLDRFERDRFCGSGHRQPLCEPRSVPNANRCNAIAPQARIAIRPAEILP